MFRSTRPHGARPRTLPIVPKPWDVSIHAPAWGATLGLSPRRTESTWGFDPRARMGRDAGAPQPSRWGNRFDPRARMGRDFTTARAR